MRWGLTFTKPGLGGFEPISLDLNRNSDRQRNYHNHQNERQKWRETIMMILPLQWQQQQLWRPTLEFKDGILAYLLWGWWGSGLIQPTFPLQPQLAGQWNQKISNIINYLTYPIIEPLVTLTMLIPTDFWDSYGGLSFGLFAGYIFEIFENSDYIINT